MSPLISSLGSTGDDLSMVASRRSSRLMSGECWWTARRCRSNGLAVHVADGDLGLGVRARPGQAAVLAQHGLALDQAVRQVDRQRHQRDGVSSQA